MATKLTVAAGKVDRINPQGMVSDIIRGLQDSVKVLETYARIVKAVGLFYKRLSENGKLRSAAITIIKESKNILRDVILRVRDNAELMSAIKVVADEMQIENYCLEKAVDHLAEDLEEDLRHK